MRVVRYAVFQPPQTAEPAPPFHFPIPSVGIGGLTAGLGHVASIQSDMILGNTGLLMPDYPGLFKSLAAPEVVEPGTVIVSRSPVDGDDSMAVPQMPIRLIPQTTETGAEEEGEPWGILAVGADKSEYSGAGVTVAILDSGIDATHPAFKDLIRDTNYKDFTGTGLSDTIGHGTHCAGIIFGRDVGGKRIGIASGVTNVLIAKIADKDALTTTSQLEAALFWAMGKGADIISMSVGVDFLGHARALVNDHMPQDKALALALSDYHAYGRFFDRIMAVVINSGAAAKSALVVAAAGNESHGDATPPYRILATLPAVAGGVLAVGALGRNQNGKYFVAPFSNEGVNICAPGVRILSAKPGGGFATMSGTSQAAPHVAGVAALWAEKLRRDSGGQPTPDSIRGHLIGRADRSGIDPKPRVSEVGDGLVLAP